MPKDFFAPTQNWEQARSLVIEPKNVLQAKNIFRGRSQIDQALVDEIEILRISALPNPAKLGLASFAVIADIPWQKAKSRLLPLNLTWQQVSECLFEFTFELPIQSKCHALGERYSGLNLRGKKHTLFTTDDMHHLESTDKMYKAIPFLIVSLSGKHTGIFLDSPARQQWDLDLSLQETGKIELLSRQGWKLYLLGPGTLPAIVQAFTSLTGRSQLPPLWSLGHQQSRWSYPTERMVRTLAKEFRQRKIPCDTLVLDIDYMDEYRVFTASAERFPNFKQMIDDLTKDNYKVVTIVDPGVKKDSQYPIYKEGKKQDLFCKTGNGHTFIGQVWPGESAMPDFIQAKTRQWWGEKHGFLLENGIAGIWNDMNEPALFGEQAPLSDHIQNLPLDHDQLFLHKTENGAVGHFELRNVYGHEMCRATHEGLSRLQPDMRPFVLTRSGYAGIQRYAAVWLGDNFSWWEHLAKSIPMLLNVGLSGIPFCGVDVGGFGGDTSPELLIRWYQLGIFYPFFRNHCVMGGRAQEPWSFTTKVEDICRKLIEWRYRLLPYIQQLFWEHLHTGAPLMRPLSWSYPDDSTAAEIDDQFLFGNDIMVAPVMVRGQSRRTIYFPEGQWYPLAGGMPIDGNTVQSLPVAYDTIPAYARGGSIIPLSDVVQSTAELANAQITFSAWGGNATGSFIEDDGATLAYKRNIYNEWKLFYKNNCFEAKAINCGYPAFKQRFRLAINGTPKPEPVILPSIVTNE